MSSRRLRSSKSQACHTVLNNPYLLDHIFSFLNCTTCLPVNKHFFDTAARRIWRHPLMPITKLDKILRKCKARRRRFYQSCILEIGTGCEPEKSIDIDLDLPNLHTLHIIGTGPQTEWVIEARKVVVYPWYRHPDRQKRRDTTALLQWILDEIKPEEVTFDNDFNAVPMVFTKEYRDFCSKVHVSGRVNELDESVTDPDPAGNMAYMYGSADYVRLKAAGHRPDLRPLLTKVRAVNHGRMSRLLLCTHAPLT